MIDANLPDLSWFLMEGTSVTQLWSPTTNNLRTFPLCLINCWTNMGYVKWSRPESLKTIAI